MYPVASFCKYAFVSASVQKNVNICSMRNAESLKEELGRARHSERLAKERLVQLTSNPNLVCFLILFTCFL